MAYTTIKKPSDYFNTKLYTGTGSSNALTGVGFQPDWTWIKCRDDTHNHQVFDAVRGVHKRMRTDTNGAETTSNESLKTFDSDGFTLGTQTNVNQSSGTFASWNWLANGAGSANTDGSITSTVSANTTSGFSIVSWTGTGANATIGHGLGSVPKMILLKCRTQADKWIVYHNSIGNTKYLVLNENDAETTSSTHWNNTSPTNSVFSTGSSGNVSGVGETFIAYCFSGKIGYSKFGSYTGTNGLNFIYTGMKPKFCMFKRTDSADNWKILDSARSTFNIMNETLSADTSSAEASESDVYVDFLSNGIRLDGTNGAINASGGSYIYMCFAEEPLVGDNPATAR